MKKRVLSMLMTLALCLTLFPAPAWAAEDTPEGGAIVQQEQQEEISPAVPEQAGTNEEENGSEGDPQNTGTPDAGGAEDSKADAPESGEDENAGNNADAAVSAVQTMIDALPIVSELDGMTADELDAAYDDIQAAYDAYEALNAEQQAQITGADFEALLGWFNSQTAPLADAQSGVHTHCVCGGNGDVNGHEHDTAVTWTTADSLPDSAGNYYLTQSVSGSWTVPEGKVTLCLNGQTISGSITVGSGATLTLTDCSDSGRVQGEVLVNGGKLELYSGTITGGVQVGKKGADYQTGSSFTMYGGAITGNEDYGGVFLVGTTNHIDPPSFTMHGGTISDNTAGASDGGGGGVYVGEKCSFTMDGGTITGNTATAGNGGGIYIHFNAGNVSISNATITGNKASATGNTSYGHGGGIYSQRGVTVKNVTITGNNSTYEGGGIYGKGAITLTDATVTDNNHYDVYYDGRESNTPELTVSGSVKAGYYANEAWKLPILVSGELSENSVIHVGVREGIEHGAIAEPATGVTLSAENFKADAADSVTSLGNDGKVYLVPCTHEMDDTGYTCKKCKTQFDARVGDSAYYKTLTDAFNAARGSTVTLLRNVTLTGNCSSENYSATLDLNGKTVSTENKYIHVGGGNKSNTLTVKDSSKGGGTQALNVKFSVGSNGTLAVDDSYTGEISRVELQAGGALERFGGKIGELVLSNAAYGSTSTGYGLKLWKGNPNACTIGKITDNTKSKSLTVNDLLGTDYAKCELYGEKDSAWSIVPKTKKISELTGYTAYKVQFTECVHQCTDDSNPVCSVCHKKLYTKITAKAADGTTKTAYFTEDSALENGYVEAIQTLNGWSNEGCTEPTLTLLRDMYAFGTSMPLTGTLTLEGGTHTAKNVTVAEGADVTFASGSYKGATIDGTATVKEGVTFTSTVTVNGTLNAKGGTFDGPVEFNGSSTANISGGSFTNDKLHGGVTFNYNVTGTISGGTFAFADFYTTKVKLSGGTFTMIKTNGDRKLADLLAEGAAYYGASDNQAVTNDRVNTLENVKVVSHTHNGGTDGNGTCSICGKKMAASLTVGGKTSWYTAFATAIEAANAADGAKTITLYQDVNGYVDGHSTTYELTNGPVTLATGGKTVTRANLTAKGISLTVTGSNGDFNVTVDGKDAELTVNDGNTKLAIVTAQNGGKLSLSNGTFSRVAVKDDGSSASLSGGSYGEIEGGTGYVKAYALLAKGYAYKKTTDNQWLPNANSISEKVTVEKAPFAVEKIYPNNNKDYTGSSAFATDGNITLTAVIAPETEGDTYYYWWELFNESENDWTTQFSKVNAATHDGKQSKTLSISGLPENSIYQYRVDVRSSNGYQCYSEPFTVTQHQHSWTYSASGATITAKCTAEGCYLTDGNGGSVTIAAPAELTYSGEGKPATVTASSDWQGPAASGITISYIKTDPYIQQLENGALPTNAGTYTASITLGEATASVTYTIGKATPKAEDFTFTAPTSLTYDGNVKSATVSPADDVIVKYYDKDGKEATPKNAGEYTVKIDVAESTNYAAANGLTADGWKFSITKAAAPTMQPIELTVINGLAKTYLVNLPALPTLGDNCKYGSIKYEACNFNLIGEGGYANSTAMITSNDEFQLTVPAVESQTEGSVGTVGVKITTDNYQDMLLTVEVIAKNKIVPVLDGEITATPITFGQILRASTITGTMKDNGKTVEGTFEWTNPSTKPDKAGDYQAEWTFTPAAGYEEYATVTGTVTIKVKPAKLTVSVNASRMYYTGKAQIASIIASGQSVDSTPVTFTYSDKVDGNYTSGVPTFTDAGTYTVYYKAEAANHEPATGTFTVTIDPLPISLLSVSSISKTYDGSADVTLTADKLTFFSKTAKATNIKLPDTAITFTNAQFTKKQADGSYLPSPEVGGGKALSFTMMLTSNNYVFEGKSKGTTEVSDVFATDDANRFTITKAAAPTMQPIELTVINGLAKTYLVNLPALPTLGDNCKYGSIKYEACNFNLIGEGGYANSTAMITSNDEFQLTVPAVESQTEGSVGTVGVKITTDNYQDMLLTVEVIAKNKIVPVLDGEITATPITFGQILRASTITGTMKDNGKTVEGTFEWTNPSTKPDKAGDYQAEWTFTPAAGYEKYATVTGTVTVKVNKATPAFIAPKAQENLTYTGQEQALITAGSVTDYGSVTDHSTMQYSLTENGTYSQNIPVGTDAGTYTVWYRVIGDANHNDTAPASVAVRIGQKPLTITGVTAASKPYDGTTDAGITSVTFDGVNLNRGTDYTVTANFDDAGVDKGKNITATVTLMGQTAKNYFLEQSSFHTTGNITKAAAPGSGLHPAVTVINDLAKTYEMVLSNDYLPKLNSPCEYGNVSYSLGGTYLTDGYKDTVQVKVMEENGQYKLKLTVPAVDYNKVSSVGTIDVRVTSDNYRDFYLTIGVKTKNKDVPVPDGTISASDITYGQALNDSKIAGKMKAGGKAIDGTFTWTNGTFKPAAGDYPASWTFTPAKGYEEYATATGTATVTVDPKAVTVSITPNGGTYGETITPATATANGVVGEDAPAITLTYTGTANDGIKYTGTTPPIKAGTYTITATITDPNYKLDADTATAEFTVAKRPATVTPDSKSKVYEEKDPKLTYIVSGVLSGETLKGITLARAEGENAGEYDITGTAASANPNYDVKFVKGTFTIEPKSIQGATVVLGKGLAANGAEQTQTVEKVLLDDKGIPADSYTVTGNTATAHGIYTLTITAKGNYTGTVEQAYVIVPAKAEDAPGEDIAIGSGKVKVVVLPEGAVPSVGLLTDKAELLAMLVNSGDITADELVQIANGASVDIVLTVKEANVSDEVKTAMAQAAKDYTIGQYLDISLFKYMTVNGNRQPGAALHTTKNALPISVAVQDALINTNSAVNRTYCIVRNHEGTITVLDAAFDAASKTLTFKTDRFSDYAIAYKDTAVPSSGSNPGSNNSSNDSETKKNEVAAPTPAPTPASTSKPSTITAMPQTGDTSNPTLYVVLLVVSLLGLAVVFVCKKRNDK